MQDIQKDLKKKKILKVIVQPQEEALFSNENDKCGNCAQACGLFA